MENIRICILNKTGVSLFIVLSLFYPRGLVYGCNLHTYLIECWSARLLMKVYQLKRRNILSSIICTNWPLGPDPYTALIYTNAMFNN